MVNHNALIFFGIFTMLILSIPNVYSETFDEQICLLLISAEQVKEIAGFKGTIDARVINANLESLNEDVGSGCAMGFEDKEQSFVLSLTVSAANSEQIAQSIYGELFSASHQIGDDVIEGNNGPWIYHLTTINDKGINSVLASIKDNIQVGIGAPATEFTIKPTAMIEILKIVQSSIDKLDISKSFEPKPTLDLYDPSTSNGVNVIFDRCENNDIWWAHLENDNGERITDAVVTLYSQTNQEIGQMGVSKKDGIFGTSTLGQDPSGIVGKIEIKVDGESSVFVDNPSCVHKTYEKTVENIEPTNGGGCLIATAAYGTELAPQVQFLREIRDNTIMSTTSGTVFMTGFNQVYYSFSPYIADLQRENSIFKEVIKVAITPMISSLSILNYVNMDSETEVLGYGISLIILNVGMYVGIPAGVIFGIKKKF
jgi:hypothetical protein